MPVLITLTKQTETNNPIAAAGNRRRGYERKVRAMAPLLIQMQKLGYVSPAQIASALRQVDVADLSSVPLAESTIREMLKRGKELGFPMIVRTRVEAAAARPNGPRRPRGA